MQFEFEFFVPVDLSPMGKPDKKFLVEYNVHGNKVIVTKYIGSPYDLLVTDQSKLWDAVIEAAKHNYESKNVVTISENYYKQAV